jgi:hypothetical protein
MAQNIYMGLCKCIWKIFTLALCRCKKIYTLQHDDKCKCKFFGVNDLHVTVDLHGVYTAIDTHIQNTGLHMAFSASFWSPYKAQRIGLLRFTCLNHCSKFTYPLCKFWQPLCYGECLIQAIVPVSLPVWKVWLTGVHTASTLGTMAYTCHIP